MSAAFTPGPWVWGADFTPGDSTGKLFGAEGRKVLSEADYENMWLSAYNKDEDAANANLIAAAPELYEALEALLKGCAIIAEKTGINAEAECLAFADSPFAKARKVLAKARGETS